MDNIRKIYVDELNKNNIKLNIAQEEILSLLVPLHSSYNQYLKKMDNKLTFFRNISMRKYTPKGIYFWGTVGTGKTMLIDLFYNHLNSSDKLRIHYQSFMLKIHKCILDIKQKSRSSNIIKEVAISISKDFKVIYIDEFYVNDITDAMIINNLFTELFKKGILILITSNFSPEDLYKDGLQRDHFIPFIELLKEQMNIFQIESDYDYRTHKLKSINSRYYIFKETIDSQKFILENFMQINNDAPIKNIILDVNGRELLCPITSKDTVVFTFDQLCRTPLGVSNYMKILTN